MKATTTSTTTGIEYVVGMLVLFCPEWAEEDALYEIIEWNGDCGIIRRCSWPYEGEEHPTEYVNDEMIQPANQPQH